MRGRRPRPSPRRPALRRRGGSRAPGSFRAALVPRRRRARVAERVGSRSLAMTPAFHRGSLARTRLERSPHPRDRKAHVRSRIFRRCPCRPDRSGRAREPPPTRAPRRRQEPPPQVTTSPAAQRDPAPARPHSTQAPPTPAKLWGHAALPKLTWFQRLSHHTAKTQIREWFFAVYFASYRKNMACGGERVPYSRVRWSFSMWAMRSFSIFLRAARR